MRVGILCVTVALLTTQVFAQESVRKVDGAGQFNKYLTPGTMDRWIIQGKAGETIVAHVRTREFDPVLELARGGEEEDTVLLSVDDDGSESRFSFRLKEAGEYKIRVHGFEFKGGGNYSLSLRRFIATEVQPGTRIIGTFDRKGQSHHYLKADKDQNLTVRASGVRSWEILGVNGAPRSKWHSSILCDETGEYAVALTGQAGTRYELLVRVAENKPIALGASVAGELDAQQMQIFSFEGKVGEFRVIEIEQEGEVLARLIHAPQKEKKEQRIDSENRQPITYLRSINKGKFQRFAVILGREDRYQVQLFSPSSGRFGVKLNDPSTPLAVGEQAKTKLPVGAAGYYRFQGLPGQLIISRLTSQHFDPVLKLYDAHGTLVAQNDDGDGGMGSRITHIVMKEQVYQLHVTSLGNGGGGDFELSLSERKPKPLTLNQSAQSTLEAQSMDHWIFAGKEGQTVLFHVRSKQFNTHVTVRGPDGVTLGEDDNNGVGTDSLLALKIPRTGRYTVWVSSRRGQGEYTIRPLSGD